MTTREGKLLETSTLLAAALLLSGSLTAFAGSTWRVDVGFGVGVPYPAFYGYSYPAYYSAPYPPPVAYREVIVASPGPAYVWVPGCYDWRLASGYVWVPGRWVAPPYAGAVWVGPRWGWSGTARVYFHGYWRRSGGSYNQGYYNQGYNRGTYDQGYNQNQGSDRLDKRGHGHGDRGRHLGHQKHQNRGHGHHGDGNDDDQDE